jgi:hypothetical protein
MVVAKREYALLAARLAEKALRATYPLGPPA